jgi:hypothetical protein
MINNWKHLLFAVAGKLHLESMDCTFDLSHNFFIAIYSLDANGNIPLRPRSPKTQVVIKKLISGKKAAYTVNTAVGGCDIVISSDPACTFAFTLKLAHPGRSLDRVDWEKGDVIISGRANKKTRGINRALDAQPVGEKHGQIHIVESFYEGKKLRFQKHRPPKQKC